MESTIKLRLTVRQSRVTDNAWELVTDMAKGRYVFIHRYMIRDHGNLYGILDHYKRRGHKFLHDELNDALSAGRVYLMPQPQVA